MLPSPVTGSLVTQNGEVKYGAGSNPGVEMGCGNSRIPSCSSRPSPTWISSITGPSSTSRGGM